MVSWLPGVNDAELTRLEWYLQDGILRSPDPGVRAELAELKHEIREETRGQTEAVQQMPRAG